jgi:transposase InsO family protein
MSIRDSPQDFECESCIQAKLTRAPLPKTVSHWEREPSELTHTDVWGPAHIPSIHGYRYYISFVDDATRQVILYYMKTKDEVSEKVKHYLTYIKRQGQKCPKAVRTDNRREYINKDLIGWCHSKGIELQTTTPHTPEQNSVAERWNRTVVELGRAMIITCKLPSELWPEAMSYATYIRNCTYTRAVSDMTPYQKWSGK